MAAVGCAGLVVVGLSGAAWSSPADTIDSPWVTAAGEEPAAPASSEADAIVFSDGEILAMLVTGNMVSGLIAHPELFDYGGGSPPRPDDIVLCPQAGPTPLFAEAPQARTVLEDRYEETFVAQVVSIAPEAAQRARFVETADALDRCHGATFDFPGGTSTLTRIKHPSIPGDARLYDIVSTDESGWSEQSHIVYARVGPVLTLLVLGGFETYRVLSFVHSALARIAEVTGSPGPPPTIAPITEPETTIPEGYKEPLIPSLDAVPIVDCVAATSTPGVPDGLTEVDAPVVGEPGPQWLTEAERHFFDPYGAGAGLLFVMDGRSLVALRPRDGTRAWRYDVDFDPDYLSIGTSVFVASFDDDVARIVALDLTTGARRWAIVVPYEAYYSGITATADTVYVSLGETWAVDALTGAIRWRKDGRFAGAADGVGLLGPADGCGITAYDASTGAARWTLPLDAWRTDLHVSGDLVIARRDDQLAAFDLRTGETRWTSAVNPADWYSWADEDGRLYGVAENNDQSHTVIALDADSGSSVWSASVEPTPTMDHRTFILGTAIDVDGGVVATFNGESVVRFDAETGAVLSVDDALAALQRLGQMEPENVDSAHILLSEGGVYAIGSDQVMRLS